MRTVHCSIPSRSFWVGTAAGVISLGLAAPPSSAGCFDYVPPSELISISITPGYAALLEIYAEVRAEGQAEPSVAAPADMSTEISTDAGGRCTAWIEIPLSTFPTSRLATRPAEVARSMREIMEKIGARECEVSVVYMNDTDEEIPEHELCLQETFEFGERKYWSKSREAYCWEPEDFEVVSSE